MLLWFWIPFSPVQAGMVGPETVIEQAQAQAARDRLRSFFDREDVRAQMQANGISPEEAQARVASLSDSEVASIAGKLDQLPAGGDALGAVLGALLLIFLILLITDLLGLTHVFPFVYHRR
jgi:hypothetical protein